MGRVGSEAHKYELWAAVETLVLEAHVEGGSVPAEALAPVRAAAPPTPAAVAEIEAVTQHDVIAFLTAWADNTDPRDAAAKAKSASRCPNVSGSPWMPWVRPTRSVERCSRPRSRRAATRLSALVRRMSLASTSCTASAVSSRSLLVMPKWTYAAASRGSVLSAQAVRKAITSCWVTASISATAAGVGGAAARTGASASAGTLPPSTCASSTSVSTAAHSSYLWASLHTRPIAGSVYRSITGGPPPEWSLPLRPARRCPGDGSCRAG